MPVLERSGDGRGTRAGPGPGNVARRVVNTDHVPLALSAGERLRRHRKLGGCTLIFGY